MDGIQKYRGSSTPSFFFIQAEDGIRVFHVTGVQTCALPISPFTGNIDVNLRGSRPTYRIKAKVKGLPWQSGELDADVAAETFGTGVQLLTNLTAEGAFTGSALDLGSYGTARNVAGAYSMSWNQTG